MDTAGKQELTLRDLLRLVGSRTPLLLGAAAAGLLLAAVLAMLTPRRYEATATIQVEKQTTDFLDMASWMGTPAGVSDALSLDVDLQTEARVLSSEALATRTIAKLNLAETHDFQPHPSTLGRILGKLLPGQPASSEKSSAALKANQLKIFRGNLTVAPLPGTRLIEIRYLSTDPALAAAVANELAQEAIDYGFEMKFKSTQVNSEALSKQLSDLRARSETLQTQVAAMQRDSGLYSTGATDAQGRQQSYSSILDQFQRASVTLSEAEQNQILKQAVYQAAKTGNAEMLSGLSGNTAGAGGGSVANSLTTVQALRAQEAAVQGQLDQLKAKFGSAYPRVAELEAEVASIETAIQQETDRISKRAESDFTVANQTLNIARQHYEELKGQADKLNDKSIHYMIARQESDESRTLYEELLKRLQQAGVMETLKSTTTSVLDQAAVPVHPLKPNVPVYLASGLVLGIILALLFTLISYALDDRIRSARDVEQEGAFLAGILPVFLERDAWAQVVEYPDSAYSEMIRNIRSALLDSSREQTARVVLVTSAVEGEGKSSLSLNLAANLAQKGLKVLLLETNFRSPSLAKNLSLGSTEFTLSRLLAKPFQWEMAPTRHDLPELHLVPAGVPTSNPAELLASNAMRELIAKARIHFDAIVLDSPPLLPVVDARVLARLADITIQVVRCDGTSKESFMRAAQLLSTIEHGGTSCVLNYVDPKAAAFRSYVGQENALYSERRLQHETI